MVKRKRKQPVIRFFYPSNPFDPFDTIFSEIGNRLVTLGIKKISNDVARVMGLGGMSVQDEIAINRSRTMLQKTEVELERTKMLSERQLRILDLKILEKESEIQRRQQAVENALTEKERLGLPMPTEVVSGALEVTADPEGLTGSGEETEGYSAWLDSCQDGKVLAILGKRGSGKTALAAKLAEYAMAKFGMAIYWIGLPQEARGLLPSWITLVDSPEQCPMGCFMIIDEAGIQYLSLSFNTDRNRLLRGLLMICRHRHCSLVFAVQSSRDLEYSVIRQADSIIFKQPSLYQPESERPDIRPRAKKAAQVFKEIPKDQRIQCGYIFDDDFEGLITSSVPSFWSEKLSNIYGNFDLGAIENQIRRGNELKKIMTEETKLLNGASLDKDILDLRQQGYGIKSIAKNLRCTEWRVRKCLST